MASYQGVDITPGTDAEVSKQIQAIDMGLSSKNLADTKGFNITPPTPSTKSQGLAGYIESSTDSFNKGLEAQAKQREQASSDSLQQYLDAVIGQKGEASLTSEAYATSGANTYQAELTDINNKILAEQHSLRRSIEALRKNPEGLYGGALQQEEQRITDESVARQADLAVLQLAKQGQFDSARQVAERAVAAKLEQQTNYLRALEINYSNNKDLFDKSEQRAFESMLSDRNRQLNEESQMRLAEFDQKIKQSDPLYQAQLAKAQKELGGSDNTLSLAQSQTGVQQLNSLTSNPDLVSAVGPNPLARIPFTDFFTGGRSNFIADVEQVRSQLTLDSLVNAKAQGATFGALSDSELKVLAQSGSKLSSWAVKDKEGNVTGYKTTVANFKKELDKINNFKKLDYVLKGGNPVDVGVQVQSDGTAWTQNSDGSYTQIYP